MAFRRYPDCEGIVKRGTVLPFEPPRLRKIDRSFELICVSQSVHLFEKDKVINKRVYHVK